MNEVYLKTLWRPVEGRTARFVANTLLLILVKKKPDKAWKLFRHILFGLKTRYFVLLHMSFQKLVLGMRSGIVVTAAHIPPAINCRLHCGLRKPIRRQKISQTHLREVDFNNGTFEK